MTDQAQAERNGVDPQLAQKYLALDAACDQRIIDLQIVHMNACAEVAEQRKRQFKMAVAEGMPKEGWRLEIKIDRIKRKAARQILNTLEDEEADVIESAEAIRDAIGQSLIELPLGKWGAANPEKTEAAGAAKAAKAAKKKGGAKVDMTAESKAEALSVGDEPDVRGTRQKEREAARQADAKKNLAGLRELPPDDQLVAH